MLATLTTILYSFSFFSTPFLARSLYICITPERWCTRVTSFAFLSFSLFVISPRRYILSDWKTLPRTPSEKTINCTPFFFQIYILSWHWNCDIMDPNIIRFTWPWSRLFWRILNNKKFMFQFLQCKMYNCPRMLLDKVN